MNPRLNGVIVSGSSRVNTSGIGPFGNAGHDGCVFVLGILDRSLVTQPGSQDPGRWVRLRLCPWSWLFYGSARFRHTRRLRISPTFSV